jgi:predicted nucleotidyltransferase
MATSTDSLSEHAERVISDVVASARKDLGDTLDALVLYGSAAEGKLRPRSDVNLIVVLNRINPARLDAWRDSIRVALAAIRLAPMFLLRDEIPLAAAAFAVKFSDIARRRRVLFGTDPFADLTISREPLRARLMQVLLNLRLRLRAAYVTQTFEDQLVRIIGETAGGLRSAAATLFELEGQPRVPAREALTRLAASLNDPRFVDAVAQISIARERGVLPPGVARQTVLSLADLAERLHDRARRLGSAAS